MTLLALDTSAAVPLLIASHSAHEEVVDDVRGADLRLTGHSLAEVYSVLTRLPSDARLAPADAADLIEANFGPALLLPAPQARSAHRRLAAAGVVGGAVYDGLVALAAIAHAADLCTRDARAVSTYRALGVRHRIVGDVRG